MNMRTSNQFEEHLSLFIREISEEQRLVSVGEKDTSELAAIFSRYADLYSREQLEALRAEEKQATAPEERERLYRLRKVCEDAVVEAGIIEQSDALENAELATKVTFRGEEMPLRAAQARVSLLHEYRDRDELGDRYADASATLNDQRLAILRSQNRLEAEVSGEADPVVRNETAKGISLRQFAEIVGGASVGIALPYAEFRDRWFDRLLGSRRDAQPKSFHVPYMRRLSPLETTYAKDGATDICLATLKGIGFDLAAISNIHLDLEDRPQKTPRAFCTAPDPPKVVHLVTRAQGGLSDYEAFLHEAGHALHFAGCDPTLPYAFRGLARDHSLTEIYSFIAEAAVREPGWHAQYFGLSDTQATENAEAARFIYTLLFRRYAAKLQFELDFWSRFSKDGGTSEGYAERLLEGTGTVYRSDNFLADMDSGFYSADYLRAWVRCAQLREHLIDEIGEDWWRQKKTGELLRALFWEGTKPSSEEIAGRIGFDPLDTKPLVKELLGS